MTLRALSVALLATELIPLPTLAQAFDYDTTVGIAVSLPRSSGCLAIANDHLAPRSAVTLILLAGESIDHKARVVVARIDAKLPEDCHVDLGQSGDSYYRIQLDDSAQSRLPYFAITSRTHPVIVRTGISHIDINRDGVDDDFRVCTSHEGLHLTIWPGKALKGTRRFHRYFPLHYDVEPSCTDADY